MFCSLSSESFWSILMSPFKLPHPFLYMMSLPFLLIFRDFPDTYLVTSLIRCLAAFVAMPVLLVQLGLFVMLTRLLPANPREELLLTLLSLRLLSLPVQPRVYVKLRIQPCVSFHTPTTPLLWALIYCPQGFPVTDHLIGS
jgi:hypothetical protein